MAKERPDGKKTVIDITDILERRRKDREGRQAADTEDGGANGRPEILPPSMPEDVPEPIRGTIARIRAAAKPLTELKKDPTVMRAMRSLPAWITPDGVTYFRTVLIVPIVALLRLGWYWSALATFVVAQLLDFVDGALAKARGCESEDGAFLDPLADKIVVLFTFAAIIDKMPWQWAYPLFALTLMVATGLTVIRWKKRKDPKRPSVAANVAGKCKLFCEAVGLSLCILGLAVPAPDLPVAGLALCSLAFGLSLLSLTGQLRD